MIAFDSDRKAKKRVVVDDVLRCFAPHGQDGNENNFKFVNFLQIYLHVCVQIL